MEWAAVQSAVGLQALTESQHRIEVGLAELSAAQREVALAVAEVKLELRNGKVHATAPRPWRVSGALSGTSQGSTAVASCPSKVRDSGRISQGGVEMVFMDSEDAEEPEKAFAGSRPAGGKPTASASLAPMEPLCATVSSRQRWSSILNELQMGQPGAFSANELFDLEGLSKIVSLHGALPPNLSEQWPRSVKMRSYGDNHLVVQHSYIDEDPGVMNRIASVRSLVHRPRHPSWTLVADPATGPHVVLALAGIFVLLHDLTVIPFALAWQLSFPGYLESVSIASAIFWTLALIAMFFRGYYSEGDLVCDWWLVAKRYLTTWFLPDIIMVACDWCGIAMESVYSRRGPTTASMLRIAKIGRLLRLAGVMRVPRVVRNLQEALDRIISTDLRVAISLISLACCTLWFTHVVGCAWFAIGRYGPSDTGLRWQDMAAMTSLGGEPIPFVELDKTYQYATALHWGVAQASNGNIETIPSNTLERLFTIFCLVVGQAFGTVTTSSLAAGMVEYRSRQRERHEKLRSLRRYLQNNMASHRTAIKVMRQATERLHARRLVEDDSLPGLDVLSMGLRAELHTDICLPTLVSHPLLRCWAGIDMVWFNRFCREVVKMKYLREEDDLFVMGAPSSSACVIMNGTLRYIQTPAFAPVRRPVEEDLQPGTWLCEGALWSEWIHVGTAKAVTVCKLLVLDAEPFAAVVQRHHRIGSIATEYCKQFHRRIVTAQPPMASWPTDVVVPFTDFGDLVYSMARGVSTTIGIEAIKQTRGPSSGLLSRVPSFASWKKGSSLEDLTDEVMRGKCTVVLDGSGSLIRIVAVTVLQLQRPDGHLFVQLGKCMGTEVFAECELPGIIREHNELTQDCLRRMLQTKLAPLADAITFDRMEMKAVQQLSHKYGVQTKYLRTVCYATLRAAFEAPLCQCNLRCSTRFSQYLMSSRPSEVQASVENNGLRHLRSLWASKDMHQLVLRMQESPVYFIRCRERGTFYTWLSASDFEYFKTESGKVVLHHWLESVVPPAESNKKAVRITTPLGVCPDADGEGERDGMTVMFSMAGSFEDIQTEDGPASDVEGGEMFRL